MEFVRWVCYVFDSAVIVILIILREKNFGRTEFGDDID